MAVVSFKCPNCDGELIFDPSSQGYKCEYCGSRFSQGELDASGQAKAPSADGGGVRDRTEAAAGETEPAAAGQEAVAYRCPSCGAEIVTDTTTAASFCYYCHNPVVLSGRLSGEYLPDKIIPFRIAREEAEKAFLEYAGKKKFVPGAFFCKRQIESLTGVYFPYWVYDVEMDGSLHADARHIRIWRSGELEYTETRHYAVERSGKVCLSNLAERALQKANAKLAEGVMPYRSDEAKEFHMGYLSGFLAERRDIGQAGVREKMLGEMRRSAERLLRETVSGYDSVSIHNLHIKAEKETWSYMLFPVWTITYKGRDGKIYYYSMNGQTGKVCGELPVDYVRLTLASFLLAVVVLALGLVGGYFL